MDAAKFGCKGGLMVYSQQPHHPQPALLHRRHFLGGQGCQRAFAETVPIQGSGLVGDNLAGFRVGWMRCAYQPYKIQTASYKSL